jgi:transcriptional regulator with XRE-family HTH domain
MSKRITPKAENAFIEVGESLCTWRKLYALKASQVAERANISLGTLRKIESGDPSVGVQSFLEVLRSLGLLDTFCESLDPLNSDLGRARIDEHMPKRIRS